MDVDLNTLSYMKLKKHLISMGIPKAEVLICLYHLSISPDDTHFIRVFHDRISPTDDTSLHITSIKGTHINC